MELKSTRDHALRMKKEFLENRKKVIATDTSLPNSRGYVLYGTYTDSACTDIENFYFQAIGLCFQPVGSTYYQMSIIESYESCNSILVVNNQYSDSSCTQFVSKISDSGTSTYGSCYVSTNNNGYYYMIKYYGGIDTPTFPIDVLLHGVSYASLNDCNSNTNMVFGYAYPTNTCFSNMKYTCNTNSYTTYSYTVNTNCDSKNQTGVVTSNFATSCTSVLYFPYYIYENTNMVSCFTSSSSPNQQPTSYPTAIKVKETATNMIYANHYASHDCSGDFYNSISVVPVGICISEPPKEAAHYPNDALSELYGPLTATSSGTWTQGLYSYCDADCTIPNYYAPYTIFTNTENGILIGKCYSYANTTVGSYKYFYADYDDALDNSEIPGVIGTYEYQEYGGPIAGYNVIKGCVPSIYVPSSVDDDYVYTPSSYSLSCELSQVNEYEITTTYYTNSQKCSGSFISKPTYFPAGEINGDDEYISSNVYNISQLFCRNEAKSDSLSPAAIAGIAVGVSLGSILIGGIFFYYFYYKGYLLSKSLLTSAPSTNASNANANVEIRDSHAVNPIQI